MASSEERRARHHRWQAYLPGSCQLGCQLGHQIGMKLVGNRMSQAVWFGRAPERCLFFEGPKNSSFYWGKKPHGKLQPVLKNC